MGVKHTIRTNRGGKTTVELTRGSAIKVFCTQCMGGSPSDCESNLCPLFPFKGKSLLGYGEADDEARELTPTDLPQ